jgi:hypothetical protein
MALRQKSALNSPVVPTEKRSSVDNPGGIRGGRNRESGEGSDTLKVTLPSKADFGKSRGRRSATSPICLVDPVIPNSTVGASDSSEPGIAINSTKSQSPSKLVSSRQSRTTRALKSVKPPKIDASVEHASSSPDENMIQRVESAIQGLGKLESDVMAALFPTDGSLPQSNEVIAQRLGMTVEEVKGISDNALRGLRGARGPGGRASSVWN